MQRIDVRGILALIKKAGFVQALFPAQESGRLVSPKREYQLTLGWEVPIYAGKARVGMRSIYHVVNVGLTGQTPAPKTWLQLSYGAKDAVLTLFASALKEAAKNGRAPIFHAEWADYGTNASGSRLATFTVEGDGRTEAFSKPVYVLYVGDSYLHLAEPGIEPARAYGRRSSFEVSPKDTAETQVTVYDYGSGRELRLASATRSNHAY